MDEQVILKKIINVLNQQLNLQATVEVPTIPSLYNATLKININDQPVEFCAIVKNVDRLSIIGSIRRHQPPAANFLLCMPYITREIAAKCKDAGIQFVDTAGNAYIKVPGLYVYIIGQPRQADFGVHGQIKRKSIANLRVIFSLLTQPDLIKGTYMEIMNASGVSLGSVQNVLNDLVHGGFVNTLARNDRRIILTRRLLDEWVNRYAEYRSQLVIQRFSAENPDWWKEYLLPDNAVWGGEVAAAKLTGSLKPAIITVYTAGKPDEIIINNRLRTDANGNVEILNMFWKHTADTSNTNRIAPLLLIYADLMSSLDSRDMEIAKQIYDQYLANIDN